MAVEVGETGFSAGGRRRFLYPAPDFRFPRLMDRIRAWFPEIDAAGWEQLTAWAALMREWNAKVNVVSRKDIDDLEVHHLAPCLAVTKVLKLMHGARVLDVGTGGGLPGLVMALRYPQAHVVMVDSVGKKLGVVAAIAEQLGVENVSFIHGRVETVKREFDFVTGRAVTNLPDFCRWVEGRVRAGRKHSLPNGVLYWRGGPLEPWLTPATTFPLAELIPDPYFAEKFLLHLPRGLISRIANLPAPKPVEGPGAAAKAVSGLPVQESGTEA